MDKVIKNKRGLELVNSRSSGYETNSQKFLYSYVLFDQVWWCNITRFLSYSKNHACKLNFMQVNSWHHKSFLFHLTFRIWKKWKRRRKLQKFEYLENGKNFLDETKNIFYSFWRAMIWWKNKNLIKIADKNFNGTVEKELINYRLRVSKVSWKFRTPTIILQ